MLHPGHPPPLSTASSYPHHLEPLASAPTIQSSDPIDANDEILQRHYVRMQQTLLAAVDKQMESVEARLSETEVALKRTEDTKKEIGVELYKSNKEVGRMNARVDRMKMTVEHAQDERALMKSDLDALEREMNQILKTNDNLQETLEDNRQSLIDSTTKINQLGEVNAAYHSDIKVQRRVQEKLRKELELTEAKRKAAEADLESIRKEREELLQTRRELQETLQTQRTETSTAQISINKMHREINSLTAQQKIITKQWEESISAMVKRDQAFQAVKENKELVQNKLLDAEKVNRGLSKDMETTEETLKKKEHENASLSSLLTTVRTNLLNVDAKARETRNALVEAQVAESLYKQELDQVGKHHELTKEELERKNATVSELKWRIDAMKKDFDVQMRDEVFMQVARKEEQVNASANAQLRSVEREHEGKNINLRHSNAEQQMKIISQKEDLRNLRHERDAYRDRYKEINSHYVKLYDESKYLIYALERKEHDVNYLKSKIQERTLVDQTRPLQMAMLKLQKDLQAARNENDRLQKMWLEGQKANLTGKERSARLEEESVFMKTQLHINDAVKEKTAKEISEVKEDAIEQKLEAARLFAELRRLQPVVQELTEKNVVLEQQLDDARLKLQETRVNGETATHMLKHEIRRLYNERSQTLKARLQDDRSTHALERKHVVAKEVAERLKADRTDLQKQNWELRKRVGELESVVKELKMVGAVQILGKRSTPITQSQRAAWVSAPGTTSGDWAAVKGQTNGQQSAHPEGEPDDVPDFEAWRLKIESLTSERQYLINDNDMLRSRVDELTNQLSSTTRNQHDTATKIRHLEGQIKVLQQQLKDVQGRCGRAERVAACLEKQFKDAKPNTRIDYQMLTEAEPSTQLLAALMPKDRDSPHNSHPNGLAPPSLPPAPHALPHVPSSGLRQSMIMVQSASQPLGADERGQVLSGIR